MLKALTRWLRRRAAHEDEALQHTDLIVRGAQDGLSPMGRLYLNRGGRYPDPIDMHMTQEGWHYTARYSRLPAPSLQSLQRQEAAVRRAAERAGWL